MYELEAPPWVVITTQLIGTWILGALFFLTVIRMHDMAPLILVVPLGMFALIGYTRTASLFHEDRKQWARWLFIVFIGGLAGIVPMMELAEAARPDLIYLDIPSNQITQHAAVLLTFLCGAWHALLAGVLLSNRRVRNVMIALTVLVLGSFAVGMHLLPPDSLERRLRDEGIDRETTYMAVIPGYTPDSDDSFAQIGNDLTFIKDGSSRWHSIKVDVFYAGDDPCRSATVCTPEDPGLTYIRTKYKHGYVRRHGQVNVRIVGDQEADKQVLRQAALSVHPVTDDELRRGLPPWEPDGDFQRFHQWLHTPRDGDTDAAA